MAKPPRSPLLGYNHNVKYKGRVYHVQTEDSGPANPRLFTHLYYEGSILASKRHEYDRNSADEVVRGLMQGQHRAILKELKQSLLDDRLAAFFRARGEGMALSDVAVETVAAEALDLDALPGSVGVTPPPEVKAAPSPAGSPGDQDAPVVFGSVVAMPSDGLLPLVVFDKAPPPATPPTRVPTRTSPPPFSGNPETTPPPVIMSSSVVVQRTVGVGGGAAPVVSTPSRPRRPAPSIPYVVKEGSHTNPDQARQAAPVSPPRPMVPPAASSANAPRTASTPQTASPADLVSDKSLDEVILAYLSQGEPKE